MTIIYKTLDICFVYKQLYGFQDSTVYVYFLLLLSIETQLNKCKWQTMHIDVQLWCRAWIDIRNISWANNFVKHLSANSLGFKRLVKIHKCLDICETHHWESSWQALAHLASKPDRRDDSSAHGTIGHNSFEVSHYCWTIEADIFGGWAQAIGRTLKARDSRETPRTGRQKKRVRRPRTSQRLHFGRWLLDAWA